MYLHENVSTSRPSSALIKLNLSSAAYQDGHLPLKPSKHLSKHLTKQEYKTKQREEYKTKQSSALAWMIQDGDGQGGRLLPLVGILLSLARLQTRPQGGARTISW